MLTLIELSQLLQATWNLSVFYYVQHREKKLACLGRRYLIGQQFQVVNIRVGKKLLLVLDTLINH